MITTQDESQLALEELPEVLSVRHKIILLTTQGKFITERTIFSHAVGPDVVTWQQRTFVRNSAHDRFYTEAVAMEILD